MRGLCRAARRGLLVPFLLLPVGCHSVKLAVPLDRTVARDLSVVPPGKHSQRVAQFVFLSDFEIKPDPPLFQELAKLGDQIYRELQLPPSNTVIQVYLFEDRERYDRFMLAKYPELPRRRAFFIAQPRSVGGAEDLLVYTYWGEHVREDLRHELTHALLHSVLKDVPLWLDEGLAEYFELPPDHKGINYHHVVQCRRSDSFQPNLTRLEQLSQVQQMNPAEYRESWAWVHLMLQSKPETKAVLLGYLQQLRTNANPGPLQPRLVVVLPKLEEALELHLASLPRPAPWVQH